MTSPCIVCRGPWRAVWVPGDPGHWGRERVIDPFYMPGGVCIECIIERRVLAGVRAIKDRCARVATWRALRYSWAWIENEEGASRMTLWRWLRDGQK